METAAAILVQTILPYNRRLQEQLEKAVENPEETAKILKPWYKVMFAMVSKAHDFDQSRE